MCASVRILAERKGMMPAGGRPVPLSWAASQSTRPGTPVPGLFFLRFDNPAPYVPERTEFRFRREHTALMKPKFTDEHKYPRGYDFSGATDITKTFAAARARFALAEKQPEGNVRMLQQLGART